MTAEFHYLLEGNREHLITAQAAIDEGNGIMCFVDVTEPDGLVVHEVRRANVLWCVPVGTLPPEIRVEELWR